MTQFTLYTMYYLHYPANSNHYQICKEAGKCNLYSRRKKEKPNTEIKQVLELAEQIYTENIINMIKDIKEMMVIMNNR